MLKDYFSRTAAVLLKNSFSKKAEDLIMSIFWFLLALGLWIILQVYVLPKFGIST